MAKTSATTGGTGELIHTRTTAGSEESPVAVIGVDGSDAVVGAPAPSDAKANPANALDVGAHGLLWDGTQWVRAKGDATNGQLVNVSDRAARELGRARIWDGTDEASVIPRGTVPAAADKGLAVVPLNQPRPSYQVVTTNVTGPTAVAVTNALTLWHPNTLLKDVFIIELGVNYQSYAFATGRFDWRLSFISAENATPGGTALTPQQLNRGDPASGVVVRLNPTGAPTLTGQIFQRAGQPAPSANTPNITAYDGAVVYRAKDLDDYSDAMVLRSGQSEGIVVQQDIQVALATAPIFNVYARWIERA